MMSVCHREGLKVEPAALSEMIEAANHDVRQVSALILVVCPNQT